jgi:Tol biopolymer transport system component
LPGLAAGRPLTTAGFTDWGPRWTPEGNAVLFASDRRGNSDVWKITPGSANPAQLTTGLGQKGHACLSPDHHWIAFTVTNDQGEQLHVMRPDGTDVHLLYPRLLERFTGSYQPDWSPDGTSLAAMFDTRSHGAVIGIVKMNLETGTARDIKTLELPGGMQQRPRWSPDGKFLAYEALSEESWDIWVATAEGGSPRRLTSDPGNERGPVWSPDGRFLYFCKDARSIWRIPMSPAARPAGLPQLWAKFAKERPDPWGLDLTKDQAVLALAEEATDLMLIELPEK